MKLTTGFRTVTLGLLLAVPALVYGNAPQPTSLDNKVRHELAMLPYYSVFDDLSFRVDGDKVTLFGEVAQPALKRDVESAIKHLEGVRTLESHVEVLPVSRFDNDIRVRTYRAIYGYGPLSKYSLGVRPSIHIIVKNGNVTLTGVVDSKMDHDAAYLRANSVPGSFAVTNELKIGKQ
jgi:hyperosmotically inducible periplasmic protein